MQPIISVLMPAYNAGAYIAETIQSILDQTYPHFELIIINDGSTDNTKQTVLSFTDKRIRYVENERNLEKIETNNKGLNLVVGEYIAKMDADDVAEPHRFKDQIRYFERHSEVSILGSWFRRMDNGKIEDYPEDDADIKVQFIGENVLANSTAMFRTADIKKVGLKYDDRFVAYAEDYKFWTEAAMKGLRFANVPEVLVSYRIHATQATELSKHKQSVNTDLIRVEYMHAVLPGLLKDNNDESIYCKLFNRLPLSSNEYYRLKEIVTAIQLGSPNLVDKSRLSKYINDAFLKVAARYYRVYIPHKIASIKTALSDSVFMKQLGIKYRLIFFMKCFLSFTGE